MKKIIIYILAVLVFLYPLLNAGLYGSEWGEFFFDLIKCGLISFLLYTIGNLISRVEKLEEKNNDK